MLGLSRRERLAHYEALYLKGQAVPGWAVEAIARGEGPKTSNRSVRAQARARARKARASTRNGWKVAR